MIIQLGFLFWWFLIYTRLHYIQLIFSFREAKFFTSSFSEHSKWIPVYRYALQTLAFTLFAAAMELYPVKSRNNASDDDLLANQMTSGRLSPGHDLGYHTLVTRSPTPNTTDTVVIDEDYRSVLLFKRQQQQAASWSESGCSSPRSSFLQRGAGLETIEDTERLVATFKVIHLCFYNTRHVWWP